MNIQELHERCVYPATRIRTSKAGGSGTIIYSKPGKEGYDTFVLTNHHVIDDAVTYKDDWDSLLKKKIKKEFIEKVIVELFSYHKVSTRISANSHDGVVIAYDKNHDLAIVKLESPHKVEFVAELIPEKEIDSLFIGTPVYAIGCSLLHDPVVSPGIITYLQETIDNKIYLMNNANIIFGNSGGSLYCGQGKLIGVPSRVTAIQLGYGVDILTWMSFACHPKRLYEFFEEQELKFLYDPSDTYEEALKRREKKKKSALADLVKAVTEDESEEEDDKGK